MDILQLFTLFVLGICTGVINTIAGGASLLTVPLLVIMGLPANAANATNRLGVFSQTLTASLSFNKRHLLNKKLVILLAIPSFLGSMIGAYLSIDISKKTIALIILSCLLLILADPQKKLLKPSQTSPMIKIKWWDYGIFFIIGLYGGFFQAGIGLFMVIALVLFGNFNILQAHATRAAIVAIFTVPALLIFIYHDLIWWQPGIALAIGSIIGGYLGSHLAVSWAKQLGRVIMLTCVFASVLYLFLN